MIHPNMATMLCFVTTDCNISADMLRQAISEAGKKTFNMISVDGDTSTNDTLSVMANGLAENPEITEENGDYETFLEALEYVCRKLSKMMAADGEGATKLIVSFISEGGRVDVCRDGYGTPFSEEDAKKVLKEKEITILVNLKLGGVQAEAYGCDLTYDYVKINGDYRT